MYKIEDIINKVHCADCLEFMKNMPDKCVDLVVTDPLYGIDVGKSETVGGGKLAEVTKYGKHDWDKNIPSKEVFNELFRVSRNQIIFGGNYMVEHLYNSSCWIVWDKDNTGDFADCELAWTSFRSAVRKIKYRWNGMLQGNMHEKEKRVHPTQKPQPVMQWILEKYAKRTDIIFDPFMGSGTTLCACRELHMDYIGVEINQEYCAIAEKRLFNTQGSLF